MNNDIRERAKEIVSGLTLRQKAQLLYGRDFWFVRGSLASEQLPDIMVTDGPSGLRKQLGKPDMLGIHASVPATAFPTASCVACSWDPALAEEMGKAMGEECVKEDVAVLLGPGANHKRDPLCGRNFEYLSEDPLLSGKLAAALIRGVQSQGVGTSLKHFACNSREDARMYCDSIVDERALREIYLKQYEIAVKESQPMTIMMAYNRLNGTHCAQNKRLMTDIARGEWGFEGLFVTDWGAIRDQVASYVAGLDLEMPGTFKSDDDLVEAVEEGRLSEKVIDERAEKVVELLLKSKLPKPQPEEDLLEKNFARARCIAEQSAVLLKNDNILPLAEEDDFCVIGAFAKTPRFQGGGSSNVNAYRTDCFLEYVKDAPFEEGYEFDSLTADEERISRAVELAKKHQKVLLFAGLPNAAESEGYDRTTMDMPASHLKLIEEVCKVNKDVVLVLMMGAPVAIPVNESIKGILLCYLAGEAGGGAAYRLLFGKANPSGKLAETFPVRYEDTPAHRYYKQCDEYDEYREGIFTGYRYYETAKVPVAYPFGHGLSYTAFAYTDVKLEGDTLSFTLTNTGSRDGSEVVELYISAVEPQMFRPEKELKGFQKIALKAGESRRVSFALQDIDFSFYDAPAHQWTVEEGEYDLLIGASVSDIRLSVRTFVKGEKVASLRDKVPFYYDMTAETVVPEEGFLAYADLPAPKPRDRSKLTLFSPIKDLAYNERSRPMYESLLARAKAGGASNVSTALDMPIINMTMTGSRTRKDVMAFLRSLNEGNEEK